MKNQSSLPKEFEQSLQRKLGDSFTQFLNGLDEPSPTSIRLNPNKLFTLEGEAVAWSKSGRYLEQRPVFTLDPALHAGAYYVQEASSMFLEQAIEQSLNKSKPVRALDLCAAPGGKSTHLLSLLPPESVLVSNEVIRSRASILAENIQKWGHSNVVVTHSDPEDFSRIPGFFDVIVVDAPCSGEGLFRKDPHAMQEWSPAHVELCAKRQQRILKDVWPALKTDGLLIYSTCTYNEQENEENLQWLSEQHNIESIALRIDDSWNIEVIRRKNLNGYRFFPHRVKGEGFFLAAFRKREMQSEGRIKINKSLNPTPKKISHALRDWISQGDFHFYSWNELIYSLPGACLEEVEFLREHLKIIHAGTPFAMAKHDKLIPEHSAALSIHLNKGSFPQIHVNQEEAIQFLRKESFHKDAPKGFTLVMYDNLPLGWVNILDSRTNNLYPKEWRIRMENR